MRTALPWILLAPWLLLACSKPPTALLAWTDPAIDRYLRQQPEAYGGIARWAHQFMLAEEAVSRLVAQGYECPAAKPGARERTCEKSDRSFASRLLGKVRSERVVIGLKHPGPRIARIEGLRYEDTARGPDYSQRLPAPGLSFADARIMADFVLDAHPDWHPRKYCFPAAAPLGCEEERKARAQNGWRHWDGKSRVSIGNALASTGSLASAGFTCESDAPLKRRTVAGLRIEDERAWIDCVAVALDGQEQRVRLGLNRVTGVLELLRMTAGKSTVEVPVEPVEPWA